ncbi:putative Glc7-interacting proteinGIP3 [Coleophoma crateriformis]|uniref:Putative Glc7-interacting proteinGIP3 n=1 Tax=Coleophoma crateriformis TaxID=565419 RepID=A0A3D8S997_9HELO|nr:putative Glc7-interacting proteinGIP3 [Coleophoma crateriformis]
MEGLHGVDVSWMQHSSKDHTGRQRAPSDVSSPKGSPKIIQNGSNGHSKEPPASAPKPIPHRPGFSRNGSTDKTATLNGAKSTSVSPSRRNSWLSSISSKFSSSPGSEKIGTYSVVSQSPSPGTQELYLQKTQSPPAQKGTVLQTATKELGEPYTPAPPKSTQPNFLQSALRRLSSSGGNQAATVKGPQHGLCERRTLNIDKNRERCSIAELDQSKLRRVAFCVDVEIASSPRYIDDDGLEQKGSKDDKKCDKKEKKKKVAERGEGEALKNPDNVKCEKEKDGQVKLTGEQLPREPEKEGKQIIETTKDVKEDSPSPPNEKDTTKKKEKKKRSEEERKARKEKKRKLAEANGTVPVELVRNLSDESLSTPGPGTPKTQVSPTTDPARIYRRCCQLRETPILKKITEQLSAQTNSTNQSGVVNKLDLTGYWLQLPDLITLGDYLAVVPVKELIMENTGLSDEGVRVILAGLLAAKAPEFPAIRRAKLGQKDGDCPQQGGFVERVVFKGNAQIGRDGWRYICLFIHMCRTLKCMDLSNVPFPQTPPPTPAATPNNTSQTHFLHHHPKTTTSEHGESEMSSIMAKSIGERLGGSELELLNMAECGMTTAQLGGLIDGACKSGLRRLGVAGNSITTEGMQHIVRFLKSGKCEGLDLGSNDLKDTLGMVAETLDENNPLLALSLADCNLTPDTLWVLFPALVKLPNFRFIDLSQNRELFTSKPSAIPLLRRYLPRLSVLKRIHLTDVALMPEQVIALAEILPEIPSLAHVSIMENPQVAALASAKGEAKQEEACALYASLMAAVRVSNSLVCIDIEVPSNDSSEVVKALAKQVVAYCLFNMERGPVAEVSAPMDSDPGQKDVVVPDVLLHLVGHGEESPDGSVDEPAPDEDYVIGGTGVVKALGICLGNRGNDTRLPSADRTFSDHTEAGTWTPKSPRVNSHKAKDMSKNLLGSARKIRARLQPALANEAKSGDRNNYQRLLFLDSTLEGMIKRFEDEYPETRLTAATASPPVPELAHIPSLTWSKPTDITDSSDKGSEDGEGAVLDPSVSDDDDIVRPVLSRHNSDVSLASKALSQEEGRMHRFGQKIRRDILKPESQDHAHGTDGTEKEAAHLQYLRKMVEDMGGDLIKRKVQTEGEDAVISELNNETSLLRQQLQDSDPEGWEKFVQSQEAARHNSVGLSGIHSSDVPSQAIE